MAFVIFFRNYEEQEKVECVNISIDQWVNICIDRKRARGPPPPPKKKGGGDGEKKRDKEIRMTSSIKNKTKNNNCIFSFYSQIVSVQSHNSETCLRFFFVKKQQNSTNKT